jgi:thymidylate synthase
LPKAPTLWLNPEIKDFYDFDNSRALKDIKLENYENLGTIKMPVTE